VLNMNQHRFDEGVTVLKSNGIRMTPQRAAILEYLANSESHPTADDIFKALTSQLPSMTNATIYNNLKCFKKYGIINELTFGQFSSRYEWKTSFHYHVVCKSCSKICDFNYPKLKDVEQYAEKRLDFNVTRHLFEIYGICSNCNKKTYPIKEVE
jgi:Fur family peroxide stress response transcriptional regulator